jgi:NADPH:quinone reductase-like Zn-dependent oxidoreductase
MQAFRINRYNKTAPLELVSLPEPALRDHEVRIQIHAASINQIDSKLKSGEFKLVLPYQLPFTLGHDLAGVIIEVGAKVSRLKVGDEVFAQPAVYKIGTFAETIAVAETEVAIKPTNMTMIEAASIPLVLYSSGFWWCWNFCHSTRETFGRPCCHNNKCEQ